MPILERLAGLTALRQAILRAQSSDDVLRVAAEGARSLTGAHHAAISVVDTSGGHRIAASSLSDQYATAPLNATAGAIDQAFCAWASGRGGPLRMSRHELRERPWDASGAASDAIGRVSRWLAVPMTNRSGEVAGLLHLLDQDAEEFSALDQEVAASVAGMTAFAIESFKSLAEANAAEARLRLFLNASKDVICTVRGDSTFFEVSQSAVDVFGYTPAELIGRSYLDFVHPEDRAASRSEQSRAMYGGPPQSFTNRFVRKDGAVAHVYWSSAWSTIDDLFFCIARDISDKIVMEQRVGRASRLEALGQLTGGIAHDFNNLLTVILGSAEALVSNLSEDPELLEIAELAHSAGQRGAELTSRLLAFARRQPLKARIVAAGDLIRGLEPLLHRTLGQHISIKLDIEEMPLWCTVDPVQLETAILNLCFNARDAMSTGGVLSLKVSSLRTSEPFLSADDLEPGDYVCISISDTGEGMSRSTLDRAFEPFFTTKPVGEGTGLGLSMVYGFIKQSGGSVKLYSEKGLGTTIRLFLPRSDEGAEAQAERPPATVRHGASVLVVEDDVLLRTQVVRQLSELGLSVVSADSGRAALAIINKTETGFDLLFTDLVMPGGMSGRQLAEQVSRICPETKILLTSGFTEEGLALHGEPVGYPLLSKPYHKADLAHRVAELLAI